MRLIPVIATVALTLSLALAAGCGAGSGGAAEATSNARGAPIGANLAAVVPTLVTTESSDVPPPVEGAPAALAVIVAEVVEDLVVPGVTAVQFTAPDEEVKPFPDLPGRHLDNGYRSAHRTGWQRYSRQLGCGAPCRSRPQSGQGRRVARTFRIQHRPGKRGDR